METKSMEISEAESKDVSESDESFDDEGSYDDEDDYEDDDYNSDEEFDHNGWFFNPFSAFGHLHGDEEQFTATERTEAHQERLEKRQVSIFVPRRCEVEGCDKSEKDVKRCQACKLVFYCSREHQKADWKRHKLDCKHLKNAAVHSIGFNTKEELQKYPIGCFPLPEKAYDSSELRCFICHAGEDEVDIGFTECCNAPICDNEHEYQMMSYSRDFCMRSHRRYTMCGSHHSEGHSGDWRQCKECRDNSLSKARNWGATNGFNLTPGLEDVDMPKGSMITAACSRCDGRILDGHESVMFSGPQMICSKCSNYPFPGSSGPSVVCTNPNVASS